MPHFTVKARLLCSSRQGVPFRRPALGLLALAAVALALSGCLQDAHNADKDFTFDNPKDPTTTSSNTIAIALVDYLSTTHTVVIVNSSGTSQDMTGWAVLNTSSNAKYTFGTVTPFTLGAGTFVRLHPVPGTDTILDLYSGPPGLTSPDWNITNVAELLNSTGGVVSACTVGSPTC